MEIKLEPLNELNSILEEYNGEQIPPEEFCDSPFTVGCTCEKCLDYLKERDDNNRHGNNTNSNGSADNTNNTRDTEILSIKGKQDAD